ncbi:MAG: hypothetical protein KatS3mg087_1310 [Patescibacteria group bacterium]|nr:MAG: hypothetical protein KatS3mg087_1310 [Patescibacteria group bacterium]
MSGISRISTTPSVVQHPRGDFFIVSESATVSRGGAGLSRTEFTSIPIDVLITEPKSMVGNLVSFNLPLTPATTVKGMKVADSGIWSVGYLTTSFDGVYRPVVPLIPPDSSPLPPRTPPQPPQPPGPPDGPKCDPRPPSPRKSPKPPRTIPREPKPVPQDPREDCRVKPPPEDPVDDCRQWVPWTPGGGEIPADRRKPGDRRINEFYVKDKDLFPRTPSIEVDESLGIEAPDWMYPRRGEIEGKIRNAGYELFGVWSNPEEPELEFVNIDWGHTALQPARPAYTWLDRRERLGAGVFLPSADLLPVGGVKLIDALDFNTSHTILDVLVYYADKINQLITAHNHAHPFYGSVKEGVGAYFGRYTSPPSPVYFLPGSIILGETETLDGNIIPDLQYLSDDRGVKEWINFSISGFPENIRGRGDITESIWDLYYTGRHTSKNQFPRIGWNNSKGVFEISQDGKTVDFNDLLKLREGSFEVKETPPDVTVKWLDSTGQKVTVTVHPGKVLDSTDTELIEIASDISFTIDYTTSTYEKADYFTGSGTVSVAAGSNAITGTNTRFLTEFGPLKRGGKKITGQIQTSEIASTTVTIIGGKLLTKREVQPYDLIGNSVDGYYRVVSIDSETTLTISTAKAFFNSTAEVIYFPVIYLGPGTWTHVDRIISDTTLYTTDSFASSYTNVNYTIGYYDPYLMDGNLTVFALKGQNGVDISWGISRDGPYGRAGYDEHYKVLGYIIVTSTPAVFSKGSVVYKWGDQRIFMKWSSHNALTHPPAAGEIIFDAVNLALAMEAGDGS